MPLYCKEEQHSSSISRIQFLLHTESKEEGEREVSSTYFISPILMCKQRNNVKQTNVKRNSPTSLCYNVKDLF